MKKQTHLLTVKRSGHNAGLATLRPARTTAFGFITSLVLLLLAIAPQAWAQATASPPGKLTYQGFLTDVNGVPLGNSTPLNTNVIFRIHTASSGGTLKWAEQQTVTIDKGHFSVLLGEGAQNASEPFTNNLSGIFAGSDASERYMEITVGGTTIAPRMQFLPAPYAMLSASARQLVDATGNPVISSTGLNISGAATATSFSGIGASLTSLNANNVSSGTLADGRLSANVALRNAKNTFTSEQTINGILSFPNAHTIQAKNAAGTYETFIHPRWSDNATYMNFGSGGFHLRNSSGTATRMFVNDAGNVGIGTSSPIAPLHVVKSSFVSINKVGPDTSYGVYLSTNGALFNQDTADVGHGDGRTVGYSGLAAVMDGEIVVKNAVWVGQSLSYSSDGRAKNIKGISDAPTDLATLLKLKVQDYTWIDRSKDQHRPHKKLVAQEVEAVFPQAVTTAPMPETIHCHPTGTEENGWNSEVDLPHGRP